MSLLNQLLDAFRMRAGPDPKAWRELEQRNKEARCPACGGQEFYDGPHGGSAINVKCANPKCGKCWWFAGAPFEMKEIADSGMYRTGKTYHLGDL